MISVFKHLKHDIPASIVVCFVAIPLCLGIALASGAPLLSGIIAGIIGGVVVGTASGCALGVSGPAAGLSAVILSSLTVLNHSWEALLLAIVFAGVLQLIAGFLGWGVIAYYFPSSVIKGMLTGIGIIIILKQIPFAFGWYANNKTMLLEGANHIFDPFIDIFRAIEQGPIIVSSLSLLLLIIWETVLAKKFKVFQLIQGPIVAVLLSILFVWCCQHGLLPISFSDAQLVKIPVSTTLPDFINQFYFPDFSQLTNINVYKIAFLIAVIASLETLLSVEAVDKLDSQKRVTPTDRELKAQGLGNIVSGLIGGLPVTQVIVRSSANIAFGARTKLSAILHGFLLLFFVATIPSLLNMIPLATLAAILFTVGYKLAKPALFMQMYRHGPEQFIPFITTILGIVFEDMLVGIGIGMLVGIFFILRHNYKNSHDILTYEKDAKKKIHLTLAQEVSFLNKGSIIHEFKNIPDGSHVIIDASRTKTIDYDVKEAIQNFITSAKDKRIKVEYLVRK